MQAGTIVCSSRSFHFALGSCFAVVVVVACAAPARAQDAAATPHAPHRSTRSYATPLALSYAIPVGVEVAVWTTFAVLPQSAPPGYTGAAFAVGVVAAPAMWVAPAVVHAVNGETLRGLGALGGSVGSTAVGMAIGCPLALWIGLSATPDGRRWGSRPAISACAASGLLGETLWAVHDVHSNSTTPIEDATDDAAALRVHFAGASLVPLPGGGAAAAGFAF